MPGDPSNETQTNPLAEDPIFNDNKFCLHPDDLANFLKLSAALRILIKCEITDDDLMMADELIHMYNTKLIQVHCDIPWSFLLTISQLYGSNVIKPNHHYATHVTECSHNFEPLHDFWTFLYK